MGRHRRPTTTPESGRPTRRTLTSPGSGVEPAAAVLDRTTAFIVDLERGTPVVDILLVSHGDTLQILQAGFLRMNPAAHRSLPGLRTAEIRQLRLR